jgi:hypothetical protein
MMKRNNKEATKRRYRRGTMSLEVNIRDIFDTITYLHNRHPEQLASVVERHREEISKSKVLRKAFGLDGMPVAPLGDDDSIALDSAANVILQAASSALPELEAAIAAASRKLHLSKRLRFIGEAIVIISSSSIFATIKGNQALIYVQATLAIFGALCGLYSTYFLEALGAQGKIQDVLARLYDHRRFFSEAKAELTLWLEKYQQDPRLAGRIRDLVERYDAAAGNFSNILAALGSIQGKGVPAKA